MTYKDRLKEVMESSTGYKTATSLGKAIGCSSQAVSHVLHGKTKALNAENHSRACQLLGVRSMWLSTGKGPKHLQGLLDTGENEVAELVLPDPLLEMLITTAAQLERKGLLMLMIRADELLKDQASAQIRVASSQ